MTDDAPPPLVLRDVTLACGGTVLAAPVDLALAPGAAVAVTGPEGSGKSALLRLCAGLETSATGEVRLLGVDTRRDGARQVRRAQAQIGFVQQIGGLLANLSLIENILLPLRYHNRLNATARERVGRLARDLDLEPYLPRLPAELPETVQHRARLARALAGEPRLLLADHILAGDTPEGVERIAAVLSHARAETRCAVLVAAHSEAAARRLAETVYALDNQRLRPL